MVAETQTMKPQSERTSATEHFTASRSAIRDLIELGELQVALLKADLSAGSRAVQQAIALVAISVVVLMSALPLLLFALASSLEVQFGWSQAASQAGVGLCGMLLAGAIFFFAWKSVKAGLSKLNRSSDELRRNIELIKQTFTAEKMTRRIENRCIIHLTTNALRYFSHIDLQEAFLNSACPVLMQAIYPFR